MGRFGKDDKKTKSEIEKQRERTLNKFFGLSDDAFRHIEWSLKAVVPCHSCSKGDNGEHRPGRFQDLNGKCGFCHGEYVVPNVPQRNWATEEINDRAAPKPKAVEMSVDNETSSEEMKEEVEKLSDEELIKISNVLGSLGKPKE